MNRLTDGGSRSAMECLESRTLLAAGGQFPLVLGSLRFDYGKRIASTAEGDVIVAGLFSRTADFQPGSGVTSLTANGDTDIFVARYSVRGKLLWIRQFGGGEGSVNDIDTVDIAARPGRAGGEFVNGVGPDPRSAGECINDIVVAPDGSIYLVGGFRGKVDFDPGPATLEFSSYGGADFLDAFVVRLNSDGTLRWARQFGGRFTDIVKGVALDNSGDVYLTGLFTREADMDPGPETVKLKARGRNDIFAMKLTSAADFVWASAMGGDESGKNLQDGGNDIAVDPVTGESYIVGTFAGRADFDPTVQGRVELRSAGRTDAFLARLDADGRLLWVRQTGGDQFDGNVAVARTPDGQIVTAGYFEDRADTDPGSAALTFRATPERSGHRPKRTDAVVSKFDANGDLIWARQLAGPGAELIGDMKLDSSGNIYTVGAFYDWADFDPHRGKAILTSARGKDEFDDFNDNDRVRSYDAFIWKLTAGGSLAFARQIGAAGDDFGCGLALDPSGRVLVTGRTRGTVDYDPGSAALRRRGVGESDIFAAVFNGDGELV